jgi:HSP20 family protein
MSREDSENHESSERRNLRRAIGSLIKNFRTDLNELMDEFGPITSPKVRGKPVEYPLTDLIDKGDHYRVEVELPGVKKRNITVEIAADTVRIKGSINLERGEDEDDSEYLIKERRDQAFNKEIILPHVVNPKEADASLEEGVLIVRVPKKAPETLEWIKIEIEENQMS